MGIYPKKLNSLAELEKEKKRLQKKRKKMEEEGLFSMGDLLGGKEGGASILEGGLPLDLLGGASTWAMPVVKMIISRLSKSEDKTAAAEPEAEPAKPGKSKIKSIAFEFIGGYLKWKAIELSFKGIKYLVKKRAENKAKNL